MGLVVFAVMGVYLLIAIGAVKGAMSYARGSGRGVKRWGFGAALVMYLIPFWDLLPTIAANQYYCATESGFFVYKTLDQWKAQNPGVIDTLSIAHLPEQYRVAPDSSFPNDRKYQLPDGTVLDARFSRNGTRLIYVEYKKPDGESGAQLNERLRRAHKYDGPGLIKLSRNEYVLIDIKTNEVLAREVNFQQSTKGKIWSTLNNSGWKFWFQSYKRCDPKNFPNGGMQRYVEGFDSDCINNKRGEEKLRDGTIISCPWRN